ncbi:MAG: hypothetical protein JWN77_1592 [Frankiales bacterium]|jgi:hypothetical protein|nr:hypothetical protein [Frankiales bacterium]
MAPRVLPALAAEVDAVAQVPVGTLTVAQLMSLVEQTTPVVSRLQGVVSRALGELQVRGNGVVPDRDGCALPLPAWLRDVARVSGRLAGRQVRTATALRELPAVVDAVLERRITPEHRRVLARLVGMIEPQALLDSQSALLEVASRTDPEQLAQYVRHQVATWCPPELERQEADAVQGRFLQLTRKHDGRTRGVFELPDADAELMLTVLEPLARRDGLDDTRPAGVRRVDALLDVFGLAARCAELPDTGGSRPRVTYVVPVDAQPADPDPDRLPPCPAGSWTGPATRATVEQLLCDARVEVLRVDASCACWT